MKIVEQLLCNYFVKRKVRSPGVTVPGNTGKGDFRESATENIPLVVSKGEKVR